MECPDCGEDTRVIETVSYPNRVRRRRECEACGHRFTTDERARQTTSYEAGDRVVSRNGNLGTVQKLAELQRGPNVTEENPLYLVHFDELGGMRDVTVKVTADGLRPARDREEV